MTRWLEQRSFLSRHESKRVFTFAAAYARLLYQMKRSTGTYVTSTLAGESVRAFVPSGLPPRDPTLKIGRSLESKLQQATEALKRVELAAELIPATDWFLYAFIRKEAVLSSQIEGTQASLTDLLSLEGHTPGAGEQKLPDDVIEVSNNVAALEYALDQMRRSDGLPVSTRLLNEAHLRLMKAVRGDTAQPGQIRKSQNWIGGTRPGNAVFVPPPPEEVTRLLSELEKYIHSVDALHPLIRTGLVHVQFETIHPYLDGNGRIGRLLILLLFQHWQLLSVPILYVSLYFKQHRSEYYRLLSEVRLAGNWEAWLEFFLDAIISVAATVVDTGRDLYRLISSDRSKMLNRASMSVAALRLFEQLPFHPIVTISKARELLATTKPTAGKAVEALEQEGLLKEVTGRRKDRVFVYQQYLDVLRGDIEK